LFWVIQRVDHFGNKFVLLRDLQHSACVFVSAAVVRCTEDCKQLTAREAFEAIHHTLVSAQDEACFVVLEEEFDSVGTKLDDVSCAVRVSDEVWLDAELGIAVSRVRPQNVDDKLLLGGRHLVNHFKWAGDLVDLLQAHQRATDAAVKTNNAFFNDG